MSDDKKILIADRDAAVRRSAASVLSATGYDVVSATDYDSACEAADGVKRAAAVVGLDLGDGPSGFVLLRELRAQGGRFPIILVSGSSDPDDILAAFRLGAADVLIKPLRPSELLCIVDREMGVSALEAGVRSGLNPTVTGENELVSQSTSAAELRPVED